MTNREAGLFLQGIYAGLTEDEQLAFEVERQGGDPTAMVLAALMAEAGKQAA
jgi:hypothetical protein